MHAARASLKNLQTIKNRSDFLRASGQGRRWVSQSLILQFIPAEDGLIRTGFTVSKKVDKSAVRRNRIRRRLKAAAADILPVKALPGIYVFIGRRETAEKKYSEITKDLEWCLKRLDCLQNGR